MAIRLGSASDEIGDAVLGLRGRLGTGGRDWRAIAGRDSDHGGEDDRLGGYERLWIVRRTPTGRSVVGSCSAVWLGLNSPQARSAHSRSSAAVLTRRLPARTLCYGERKVAPPTSRTMSQSGVHPAVARDRARRGFATARARVVERLVRDGMPSRTAEPLVEEWLWSTEMLVEDWAAPLCVFACRFALWRNTAAGTRPAGVGVGGRSRRGTAGGLKISSRFGARARALWGRSGGVTFSPALEQSFPPSWPRGLVPVPEYQRATRWKKLPHCSPITAVPTGPYQRRMRCQKKSTRSSSGSGS